MEHYRSVFAVAGVITIGLVTVSHIVYPKIPMEPRPRANAVMSGYAARTTWVDPPPVRAADLAPLPGPSEPAPSVPRPASFTLLEPGTLAALVAAQTVPDSVVATTPVVRRRRAQRVVARLRTAATAQVSPSDGPATAENAGEAPARRSTPIDPIGDLLRGLGIGREG